MNILIVIFLTCVLSSLAYWYIVQPTLMQKLRFNLFAIRDRVRAAAINGEIHTDGLPYQNMESYLCGLIATGPVTSLATFLQFKYLARNTIGEKELEFFKEDPKILVDIRYAATVQFIKMMIINSPFLALMLLLAAFALWFRGKLTKEKIYRDAENYAESLPKMKYDVGNIVGTC
ncbi:MAG: hypothetical protein ACP5I8_16985 [Phycisphaerae bacterium]